MRRPLGKGLTQLMGEQSEAAPSTVPISSLRPNSHQPRRHFDEDALSQLAQSIAEVGVLLPLIVRPVSDEKYEIIAGERRWRAAQQAGLLDVPVIIRSASAQDSLEIAIIENVQREDISAIECALAYKELADTFGLNQDQIAKKVGKSRVAISNTLRLLRLPETMQAAIGNGSITEGHARAILMIDSPAKQQELFERIVIEGISVREAERIARGDSPKAVVNGSISNQPKSRQRKDPIWGALENGLSEYFGSPVILQKGDVGGKMVIEFYSDEDLQRILDILGVGL